MICTKCKKSFDPQSEGEPEIIGGYSQVVELTVTCPNCHKGYSAWVEAAQWSPIDEE